MRDVRNSISPVKRAQTALLGNTMLAFEEELEESTPLPATPTGCWSELSSCQAQDQVYLNALKSYAQVYAAYQDYLTPEEPAMGHHDDVSGINVTEEHTQLGLLSEHAEPSKVTDDEIDSCGYLGWLRH